jgi:dCTP deaminase
VLTDEEIIRALAEATLAIDPFDADSLQPASYDLRVGNEAYVSGTEAKIDVANRGLVVIDAGEFAVLTTRERVHCGPQVAAQLGLCSPYARQGLTLLSDPQIDPGFDGVLVVRVTNLAPRRITLAYEAPFLTVQFFKLNHPVAHPYSGSRQGQTGLGAKDIEELSNPDSPTLGGMVKSLTALARDVSGLETSVSRLEGSVSKLTWVIPTIVGLGVTIIGVIVTLK